MNTTIAISMQTKEQLMEFGNKGESYDQIIEKLLNSAKNRMLHELLMDTSDSIPIDEALERAKKRWQK